MVLKLNWPQKGILWDIKKGIFQVFANVWLTKLKWFYGKVRQRVQNCLNQNLLIRSFLGNDFETTLSSKTNILTIWEGHFSVFCKFLSDEVKTIFWESEAKRSKLFKSKFGYIYYFENGFRAIWNTKTSVLSVWIEHFFKYLENLSDEV